MEFYLIINASCFITIFNVEVIVIPNEYQGKPVKYIADYAFQDFISLINITIPSSETSIGKYSFSGCSSLTTVFYNGTKNDWNKINIYTGNDSLISSTIYYYS